MATEETPHQEQEKEPVVESNEADNLKTVTDEHKNQDLHTAATEDLEDNHTDDISPAAHIEDTKAIKMHIYIARHPFKCYCFFLIWFILCGVIVVSVPGLLAFSTDVPFYIRNNKPTTLSNSLTAGKADASWQRQTTNSATKRQSSTADVNLQLIYKPKDGNTLMRHDYLELMDEIEEKIKSAMGYDKHCLLIYNEQYPNGICSRQTSITNFFDEDYFIPSSLPLNESGYTLYPSFQPNFVQYFLPSLLIDPTVEIEKKNKNYSQQHIDDVVSYWAGYDKGHGPPEPYVYKYYNGKKMPPKFYYKNIDGQDFAMSNIFAAISGKTFSFDSPLDTDVDTTMTIFPFGMPLQGYNSSESLTEEQQSEMGKWCYDELHDVFTEFQAKHEDKIYFYWGCSDMRSYYSSDILLRDGLLMLVTILSVYILMIINTGSVWLASCGMAMIFLNFLPAFLLYGFISAQKYFGTLQMMGMFIILSIGADDIFVIVDTWQQYQSAAPNQPMEKRLTATLAHAGKVMLTTSLSTCFSFIANTTSVFPAVYTFGWFAAWLVFVNYCAVILFYPTVLAVHERYFYTRGLKRGCCITKGCAHSGKCKICCFRDNVRLKVSMNDNDEEQMQRAIDKFFEFTFYPFVERQRGPIIAISGILFLVFFYFAAQLEADPDVPQFFPDGNNYQEFGSALTTSFASETGLQLTVDIMFGIDGIDRSGTEVTVGDDIGNVIYSKNISFNQPQEQRYIASLCDDLLCVYSDYNCRYAESTYYDLQISNPESYGGARTNVVKCFMTAFRDWVLTDYMARPNDSDIEQLLDDNPGIRYTLSDFDACKYGVFPVNHTQCFNLLFTIWSDEDISTSNPDYKAGLSNYDYYKQYIWAKAEGDNEQNVKMKFFTISVLTEATITIPIEEGVQLFNDWQQFGENWRTNIGGQNPVDQYGNVYEQTPNTLESLTVTDRIIFSYYFIQKQIIGEAIFGIGLSLALAFVVLTLATQNWIIAMFSCFVIFVIVICVMGFATMNGWKLGVIEAVIYVMVVGMSVDYVVHLSEAYLASRKYYRKDRARRMLGIVGSSVMSGAISTLIGIFWLFLAVNFIFFKFGTFIFFLICASCGFSLFAFTATMTLVGPQGHSGDIVLCAKRCWKRIKRSDSSSSSDKTAERTDHVELA